MGGFFITFEGTDGSGKSTQIELLNKYFTENGYESLVVREPGSTPIGEKIRDIIIDKENKDMGHITEALLYAAARAQLVEKVIVPALRNGKIVISDRFLDSNVAYQGYGRNLGEDVIKDINKYAVNSLEPDVTFFLKTDPEECMKRMDSTRELDRLESEKAYFHKKVYEGYINIAEENKERVVVLEGRDTIENIHQSIVSHLKNIYKARSI
ncbi:MAG: dTMP kinase [Firmicutes bacterium]|nr:dTMP kinase [Bacillota bacterium]